MTFMRSPVYVNYGRFVVECPQSPCGDAREVQAGQSSETCVNGHTFGLNWHRDLPAVTAELGERGDERRRNWFPPEHPLAVALGQPHGQSVAELQDEHAAGVAAEQAAAQDKRAAAEQALAGLGLSLNPDGTIKGI